LAPLGGGVPDLLVSAGGCLFLVEVKKPAGPRGGKAHHSQSPNEAQERFFRSWSEHIFIVHTSAEALLVLDKVRQLPLRDVLEG
jgi:hypothetical protein